MHLNLVVVGGWTLVCTMLTVMVALRNTRRRWDEQQLDLEHAKSNTIKQGTIEGDVQRGIKTV